MQALEQSQTSAAVQCLRSQLAQLVPPCDPVRLHRLSTRLLASFGAEAHALDSLPSTSSGRQGLIASLQVPPLPPQ